MLTKILTAAVGLIVALILLRFFAERAHRAQVRARANRDAARHVPPEAGPDAKPGMITLEVDPDTGVYRPKG